MPKRVLVVDDEPPTVRMIRMALEEEQLQTTTARNGAEALLAIESEPPDLVILDVIMPVMDGFETLRLLRKNQKTRSLPVIMLTARTQDEDVLRAWMTGVDLYLTKPFTIEELLIATRRILSAGPNNIGNGDEGPPSPCA
jgi:two-component system KDP operon response regulator KdpE